MGDQRSKKFAELISQIKELVDGLQEITKTLSPMILLETAITHRISTMADADKLQLISEASEKDYPAFSQVAALKSEVLTMSDTRRADIEGCLADETPILDSELVKLENMDVVEQKHYLLKFLEQQRQRQ